MLHRPGMLTARSHAGLTARNHAGLLHTFYIEGSVLGDLVTIFFFEQLQHVCTNFVSCRWFENYLEVCCSVVHNRNRSL